MRIYKRIYSFLMILVMSGAYGAAYAADSVGSVIMLKGKTVIQRDKKEIEAKVKDGILLEDIISTRETSRAKMLFIDDSVLNLGEKSRVVIREFVYGKGDRGKSIFNLLDGKMRSVVGKSNFEVHTPTAVAAARGTVILFEVWKKDDKKCSPILTTQGEIILKRKDLKKKKRERLTPEKMIAICEGEPWPSPRK